MRLDGKRRALAYEAALILRAAGWEPDRVAAALRRLGLLVPLSGPLEPTPLVKALYYHRAYELALRLRERLGWGYKRVAAEVRRVLGVNVPPVTIRFWLNHGTRPNITPIRLLPELGYVVGVLMTDCTKSDHVRLRVRDRDFAEEFARALSDLTGKSYEVSNGEGGLYAVGLKGSALRYIAKSGLWKVVGLAWPIKFLQGLFDGDGGVAVYASQRTMKLGVEVVLCNSDLGLLNFAKRLLEELGIWCSAPQRVDEEGEVTIICGKRYVARRDCWVLRIKQRWSLKRFAALIDFRVERRRKLEDFIKITERYRSNKERVKAWLEKYEKRNGRWVPRPPLPGAPTYECHLFITARKLYFKGRGCARE